MASPFTRCAPRFPLIARRRRHAGAAVLALLAAGAGISPLIAAGVRRAAVSDTELAAESDGVLYLEVLAGAADTAEGLAARYAGSAAAAPAVREANGGLEPAQGVFYRLPLESLLEERRRAVLAALFPEEIPASPLEFASDGAGPYAVYRLRPGEALYSAVVVRFTGRLDPSEVNTLAALVAGRSGITDLRSIPAGYPVKIPLELISPEYLPAGAPEKAEVEAAVAASARQRPAAGAARLSGVHIIMDAGHGGDDSGAVKAGVHEKEYAYDIMCRVRDLLLRNTKAEVITTIRDRSTGYRPLDGRIRGDSDEQILSDPPYDLRSRRATTTGVNLRWRIANSELDRLTAGGVSADRIVFLSIHADSLHPSIRGTMLYVPGPEHRRSIPKGMTASDLRRSEGLSRGLARRIVGALRENKINVEPYLPIRNHVIRSGRDWIPAVLRDSRVPHSLLIEVANLNNDDDRALILSSGFRQEVAEAIVSALTRYYGEPVAGGENEVARGRVPAAP